MGVKMVVILPKRSSLGVIRTPRLHLLSDWTGMTLIQLVSLLAFPRHTFYACSECDPKSMPEHVAKT
jgi:hypothetical protein